MSVVMDARLHYRKNIFKYFEFSTENNKAICKMCRHVMKKDRVYNLKKHLLKLHDLDVPHPRNSDGTPIDPPQRSATQNEFIKVKMDKKQLFRSYIGLIVEDNLPLEFLDTANMRNIVDPYCQSLGGDITLNSTSCRNALKAIAENIRIEMKSELRERLLSLKISTAARLSRPQRGISAQFITNGQVQSRILGLCALEADVAIDISMILRKYDICLSQIVSITTDIDASMMQQTNRNTLQYEAAELDNTNAAYLQDISLFGNMPDEHLADIHICLAVAHIAQLCTLDVSKNANISNYLLHCRNLTKFIRKPANGYAAIFALKEWQLPRLDCPNRWGSTYQMIADLRTAKHVLCRIEAVTNKSDEENFNANESFWCFVECYLLALSPLQKAIMKFQQEELHYGDFYAQWLKCRLCTEKIPINTGDSKNPLLLQIRQNLLQSMENRTKLLFSNEGLTACLYLDPRFNHTLSELQKLAAANYLKRLWDRINELNFSKTKHTVPSCSALTPPAATTTMEEVDENELLNAFLTKKLTPKFDTVDVYTRIVNLQLPYLRADTNVMSYWQDRQLSDPDLCALSSICFAVPANVLAFEQTYSTMTPVLADKRNQFDAETLQHILLIKLNPRFVQLVIDDTLLFEDYEESE